MTGGTGAVGSDVARHLVARHGVRSLLPAAAVRRPRHGRPRRRADRPRSRGPDRGLRHRRPDALAALLASVPAERPLTGVVHSATILDDATVAALTPERPAAMLRARADAAWHIHGPAPARR
ncbi:KR domain-containing protein [Streptomyces sp. NPDC050422]|uniref:KR domain-containing protein n=1 Tax=Streptomyces sp. NPDC050422 TaxID=3365614 RepID=UPI0037AD1DAC